MLENQLIQEFRQRLVAETESALAEGDDASDLAADAALAEVMLGDLEEAGALGGHEPCPFEQTTGRGRCRIIGYALSEDTTRLELITARYVPPSVGEYLSGKNISEIAGQAARFFSSVAKGEIDLFASNEAAADAARLIQAELDRIEEVRVHILTNALARERSVNEIEIAGKRVEFSVWDLERLYRTSGEEITRDRIEVDFTKLVGAPLAALEMRPPPSEYQTFLLVMPGDILAKLYDEFGPRLFEFNVRSFLQARGQVNKGIRDTLRSEPERFLAYNNGLTATADEIEVGSLNGETVIRRLKGLQIVNGAQTTASIHRARKIDKIDVSRVAVSMKLTRVQPDKLNEFVPLIAKFANTQNPVQLADLSANNEFHIAMERLSEQEWAPGEESRWFYERARGAYEVARMRLGSTPSKRRLFDEQCPKNHKFSKTDLAKVWMTWWEKPHVVSRGAQKNFAAFMADIADRLAPGWTPDDAFYRETIALVILFKACQSAVRRAKLQSYGANVVTFMMAKLKDKFPDSVGLEAIWDAQSLSPQFSEFLVQWAPLIHQAIVEGAGSRNVTEFSKKEECWERIKELTLPEGQPLPPELSGRSHEAAKVPTATVESAVLIDRCTSLDGVEWAKVFAWAASSSNVTDFDKKVAHTLLGYAIDKWSHHPSEKQARYGARVLDAAEKAGVLKIA